MAKNKYDFVSELLEQKKINPSQKERILKLVSQEFKNDSFAKDEIESRLKIIEEILEIDNKLIDNNIHSGNHFSEITATSEGIGTIKEIKPNPINEDRATETQNNFPKYIFPKYLYQFLFEYNQNQILKSTCHEIDADAKTVILEYCDSDDYDFKIHYEKILSAYVDHEKLFAPPSIKALIKGYLTGKDYSGNKLVNGWSSDKIKFNWANETLATWSSNNLNLPPNSISKEFLKNKIKGFELITESFTSQITAKRVQTFRELVLHFKSLIHIRSGEDSLHKIIVKINEREKFNEIIDFEINEDYFPMNIELFTDVDKLIQAYKKFIELIIEQHPKDSKPLVRLKFCQEENYVNLSILHLNNKYNKTQQDTSERLGQTYTNLIKKQINGMCNLYLQADFGREGFASVNLWNNEKRTISSKVSDDFNGGVEHIMQFCKK